MKKWLKGLVDYCFGEYLQKLRDIHLELIKLRGLIEAQGGTGRIVPRDDSSKLQMVRPLQPLAKGAAIFTSPQDKL